MGAHDEFLRKIAEAIKPDERIGIAEWSARYRILPENSPEPGRWRNERTPYLVGIMDALSGIPSKVTRYAHDDTTPFENSFVRLVGMQKGHQLGGSALGENFVGKNITSAAGNMLAVFATKDDAEKWEMDRFEPMRVSTPELRKRIPSANKKGSNNTKLRKKFPGGMLNFTSATRAGRLKSSTIRYVLLEEVDEYQLNVDGQGNPIDLALNRTSNYGRRAKVFANSTPTIKGKSQIEKLYERGDQRRYFVHCPECKHPQFFKWDRMKWINDDPSTVLYHCEVCAAGSPEHLWKTRGYDNAYWMPTAVGDGMTASFHLSAMYAPLGWRPWAEAVRDWIEAQTDISKLIAFVNNFLAECWQDVSKEVRWEKIKRRAEPYQLSTIPVGCLILTAAVDTQGDRLEVGIDGWGRGMKNWTIDHIVIRGDPTTSAPWEELDKLLDKPIRNSFGIDMRIQLMAIDSGGSATQEVYDYCRLRQHRGVFAVKGAKESHKPIIGRPSQQDVTVRGATYKNGVQLWSVGTDTAKDKIYASLLADDDEGTPMASRRMRFPDGLDDEYYKQLVAEYYNPSKDRWEKIRTRNEVLDCKVYNLACAYHPRLRVNCLKESDWIELENALEPRIADLFSVMTQCIQAVDEAAKDLGMVEQVAPEQQIVVPPPQPIVEPPKATVPAKQPWIAKRKNWINGGR